MSNCVSRDDVLDMLNQIDISVYDGDGFQKEEWVAFAKNLPSVEPERKTGKWIDDGDGCFKCSKCNTAFCWSSRILASNFCPECGADMRKE